MSELTVKGFAKITAKPQALLSDRGLNIPAGELSISPNYNVFDKAKYLSRKDLTDSQKDWGSKLQEGDGTVIITINNDSGKFDVIYWLSALKAIESITVDKGKFVLPKGAKYQIKSGVLLKS